VNDHRITVLVPAHNEAVTIAATLSSLNAQSRRPDRVVVIADNCTDETVAIATATGVDVQETVANTDKKAGGLNQALARILPTCRKSDLIMVMDADTVLSGQFLALAEDAFAADPGLGAVGGLFYGDDGAGLIGRFQRNEYHRYQRDTVLKGGTPMVLTGTASLFRAEALREVANARGETIPGPSGLVYDTLALTEDNELTIALKTLGWSMTSPAGCTVVTEVMPDWSSLWRQRERWMRGALENLRNYGWTPVTRKYWLQQAGMTYGVIALWSFVILLLLTLLSGPVLGWSGFWIMITAIFIMERVVTVWRRGLAARITALMLFPEIMYDTFIQAVFLKSSIDFMMGRDADWNHVPRTAT
jgi:poly-beta-1,6-N-acetyl-D-glucosamine synthase